MSKHSMLIQWSEEDKAYIATVSELPGLSAFGSSPEEAVKELLIAKKAYLDVLEEDGEEIPEPDFLKPFSGQTRLRLPKTLHESLTNGAKKEGVSLNTYIVQLLSERNPLVEISHRIATLEDNVYKTILRVSKPLETPEAVGDVLFPQTKIQGNDLYEACQ